MEPLSRRRFLQQSALAGGSLLVAGAIPASASAPAEPLHVPVVDELTIREITDTQQDIFLHAVTKPGLTVRRFTGVAAAARGKTLESEWGLALHLASRAGAEHRNYLLDFGFTSDVYANNRALMAIDLAPVDALLLSHGHYDHSGGLMGFLEADRWRQLGGALSASGRTLPGIEARTPSDQRERPGQKVASHARLRPGLRLYTGGEGNFCWRYTRSPDGTFTPFGTPLDRKKLKALDVEPVLSEAPLVVAGQAFTTGAIPRVSFEHVLPNTWVEYGLKAGLGCNPSAYHDHQFTAQELDGSPVPDQHWHEQATCFHLRNRGLVVITSCGHAGIINTLLRARQVSGIDKIHALVGGFHLGPAPEDYLRQEMTALKAFAPDYVLPMHCSGQNFIDLAKQEMPNALVLCCTGSTYQFTS